MRAAGRQRLARPAARGLLGALLLVAFARAAAAQLTIRLPALPPATPPGATVYVAGTFNGWNPAAPNSALARRPDGAYALTLPDSVRGPVAFKLTLGAWNRVEVSADGADVPNRTATAPAEGADTVTAVVAAWRAAPAPGGPARRSTARPGVRVLAERFPIPQLGRTRRVWIYLPPGYAASRVRYPVLYLHDGQNVFDAAASFAGEWGVDETLDSLAAAGAPRAIVVAVDHGGGRRLTEYNPWRSRDPRLGGGEGDAYVRFIARTLKSYVDARFRTRPEAAHTVVAGSSMGGLISLYAALRYPEVFGGAGVFSCACWTARPAVYAFARRARPGRRPVRLYFVAGGRETADGQQARDQSEMLDTLRAAGFGRTVVGRVVPAGEHNEAFWRREFPAAYLWLLGSGARERAPR